MIIKAFILILCRHATSIESSRRQHNRFWNIKPFFFSFLLGQLYWIFNHIFNYIVLRVSNVAFDLTDSSCKWAGWLKNFFDLIGILSMIYNFYNFNHCRNLFWLFSNCNRVWLFLNLLQINWVSFLTQSSWI